MCTQRQPREHWLIICRYLCVLSKAYCEAPHALSISCLLRLSCNTTHSCIVIVRLRPAWVQAVIYKPSGPTAQYGYDQKYMHGGIKAKWKVRLPAQEMWVNPLIGWSSSADTAESAYHKMTFVTPQEAAAFLEKQGIPYEIDEKSPNFDRAYRPKRFYQYGDNFRCSLQLRLEQASAALSSTSVILTFCNGNLSGLLAVDQLCMPHMHSW